MGLRARLPLAQPSSQQATDQYLAADRALGTPALEKTY